MKKVFLLSLLLCSCGFTPMFVGSDADIYVAPISGINGIELRNALNAKFGGAHDATAKYKLTVNFGNVNTSFIVLTEINISVNTRFLNYLVLIHHYSFQPIFL